VCVRAFCVKMCAGL